MLLYKLHTSPPDCAELEKPSRRRDELCGRVGQFALAAALPAGHPPGPWTSCCFAAARGVRSIIAGTTSSTTCAETPSLPPTANTARSSCAHSTAACSSPACRVPRPRLTRASRSPIGAARLLATHPKRTLHAAPTNTAARPQLSCAGPAAPRRGMSHEPDLT